MARRRTADPAIPGSGARTRERAPPRPLGDPVLDWLLEPGQPSVRFLTLTRLLHRPASDPEVRACRGQLPLVGWAAQILADRLPNGAWVSDRNFYGPKYQSTNWKLLVLADLGLTREDPRIAESCEAWIERMGTEDGGFSPSGGRRGHLCTTGNTVRALIQFGYEDDRRVRAGLDWLVGAQAKLGGWSCFGSGRNLDSWEPLTTFAAYPRERWTPEMRDTVARGAEFFLSRELHLQGAPYEPWNRFHYPVHYYYDLLVGLGALSELGYAKDPRLGYALDVLRAKRTAAGRWDLDAVHPDVEGPVAAWFEKHPKDRPIPLAFEEVGQPSKMITLAARRVLDAVEATGSGGTSGGPT